MFPVTVPHRKAVHAQAARIGIHANRTGKGTEGTAEEVDEQLWAVKRVVKPISVVFWQLVRLISATSLGSAKVMSTHCVQCQQMLSQEGKQGTRTLYSAAPCCASITT